LAKSLRNPGFASYKARQVSAFQLLQLWHNLNGAASTTNYTDSLVGIIEA
jgi:hypothetical protein